MKTTSAGWFPDPSDAGRLRYWDGTGWTQHVTLIVPAGVIAPPAPPVQPSAAKPRRRFPMWAWLLIAVPAAVLVLSLSPVFAVVSVVVLITAIVALSKNTRTWLRLRSRRGAATVTAVSAVTLLITAAITTASIASVPAEPSAAPASTAADHVTAIDALPRVDDSAAVQKFAGRAATIANTSATMGQSALEVLATLEVKGRAPKTGYERSQFGQAWLDVDRNGCDTRNDILGRDLSDVSRSGSCKVMSGKLADPYTGRTIDFTRGPRTSALVQIDHVVALSDAWQKGAQQLTVDQRTTFANDPLNLLAVDGAANTQKKDGDAATWLPKNKAYRCAYVARQVSVKATYALWVTQAEHDAIAKILSRCPDEPAVTSTYAAKLTTKEVSTTEAIAFTKRSVDDPSLPRGRSKVTTAGKDGVRRLTYVVTLIDGEEVSRALKSTVVSQQPVAQVTAIGSYVAPPPKPAPAPPAGQSSGCDPNYAGGCVPIASDVDCGGGSGNGPAYFWGTARVVGTDIYGLDRDQDGIACE